MYAFLEEKNCTDIAENNVLFNYNHTKYCILLIQKTKIQLINGLSWIVGLRLIVRNWDMGLLGIAFHGSLSKES